MSYKCARSDSCSHRPLLPLKHLISCQLSTFKLITSILLFVMQTLRMYNLDTSRRFSDRRPQLRCQQYLDRTWKRNFGCPEPNNRCKCFRKGPSRCARARSRFPTLRCSGQCASAPVGWTMGVYASNDGTSLLPCRRCEVPKMP